MKEIVYNKLVRDKIPGIIESDGKTCEIEILSDGEKRMSIWVSMSFSWGWQAVILMGRI